MINSKGYTLSALTTPKIIRSVQSLSTTIYRTIWDLVYSTDYIGDIDNHLSLSINHRRELSTLDDCLRSNLFIYLQRLLAIVIISHPDSIPVRAQNPGMVFLKPRSYHERHGTFKPACKVRFPPYFEPLQNEMTSYPMPFIASVCLS